MPTRLTIQTLFLLELILPYAYRCLLFNFGGGQFHLWRLWKVKYKLTTGDFNLWIPCNKMRVANQNFSSSPYLFPEGIILSIDKRKWAWSVRDHVHQLQDFSSQKQWLTDSILPVKLCLNHHFFGDVIGNSGRTGPDEMLTVHCVMSYQITKPALLLYSDRECWWQWKVKYRVLVLQYERTKLCN